jgi:hypothetical protein
MYNTKGEMQQIMVSSSDLRACQTAGMMTVHPSLSEERALMSQTTGEQIGSGEYRASTSARQAIAVYATEGTLLTVPLVSPQNVTSRLFS